MFSAWDEARACDNSAVALLGLSCLGFGLTHGKQQKHEERNQMLTQKQTFY